MRKQLGWLIGLSVIGGIALPASGGGGAAVSMEKILLNIRILQSYKKVLARYGQPTRIYQRTEAFDFIPAVDSKGNPTGGVKGLADMEQPASPGANTAALGGGMGAPRMSGGGAMGAPRMGSMGGSMMPSAAMSGVPGMSGGMMGGPRMSGMGGSMGGGSMGGARGGSMGGMMAGSMGGSSMMPGAPPAAGMMGGGGGAASGGEGYRASGGYVWVYLFREKELAYTFHFNKDGRVEMIGEFGWRLGIPTSKSLKLGDPVKNVYSTYGYPDNMMMQGDVLTLLYNQKHHAQFDIQNNKVTGIAIFLHESQKFERGGGSGSSAGSGMGRVAGSLGAPARGGGRVGEIRGTGSGGGGASISN